MSKNVPLSKLAGKTNYQTLYSFETEKSTNYHHIKPYLKLAEMYGEVDIFMLGIIEELRNG